MELLDITGVGPATARLLTEAGFATVGSVAVADPEELAAIRGIGPVSAESIKTGAQRLAATGEPEPDQSRRAEKLRKRAKKLQKQARQLTKRAKKVTSKKKRKRLAGEAARLEKAARKARRKAKKLLAGRAEP
jgi:NAD-dependent DNA ligase